MGIDRWVVENWFVLLQSAGILAGLIFTGISLQIDARVRRVQNLLTLTEHHRDIWAKLYQRPELSRLLLTTPLAEDEVPTIEEELFVNFVVLHLNSVHHAMKRGMFITPEGLRKDIRSFFTLPIPQAAWTKLKAFQDRDFVEFVDAAANTTQPE